MRARALLIVALLVALPGLLWQAFEMYGLTFGGEQMLFFSIVHTMPIAVLLVLLAFPASLIVLVQTIIAFFRTNYMLRLGLNRRAVLSLLVFLAAHFAALAGYEFWASIDSLRPLVCIVGIALFIVAAVFTLGALSNPFPSATGDA